MDVNDVFTPRLRLVAMTPEMMSADAARSRGLAQLLRAEVPASWPPEHWEPHVFSFMERQIRAYPHTMGWNRYVVLCGDPETLIGNVCGFPWTPVEAEIGYALLEPWQRKGLATEAVRAYLIELFQDGSLQSVTAQTYPALTASVRLLERCGFSLVSAGEEAGAVRYRRWRADGGEAAG